MPKQEKQNAKKLKLGLIAIGIVCLTSCQKSEPVSTKMEEPKTIAAPKVTKRATPKPKIKQITPSLPQLTEIKVAFNQSQSSTYTDPYRNITRHGTDLEALIVKEILSAEKTIDIAIQALSLPTIAQVLAQRKKAGIKIRVIMENNYAKPWIKITPKQAEQLALEQQSIWAEFFSVVDANNDGFLSQAEIANGDVLTILNRNNIPWKDDTSDSSSGSGLMHHKFIVIDQKRVISGSPNFTLSSLHGDKGYEDSFGNTEHLLIINSSPLAKLYTEEFNFMWNGLFGVNKPKRQVKIIKVNNAEIKVNFSPDSQSIPFTSTSNGLISQTIGNAKQSVDFALFVFSDQEIANQLQELHRRNLRIRGIIDSNFAYVDYSKTLDMCGLALANKDCKINQIPWQRSLQTIGVPSISKADKMHHKFAVIDNSIVITGSHNWTAAGNYRNDENLLVINSPIVAAHFNQEMERLLKGARFNPNKALLARAEKSIEHCGFVEQKKATKDEKVNLNTASVEELDRLPRIGKSMAQRIIEARPLQSWEGLGKVKGMSRKKMEKLKDKVSF
jgi:phosphatidylserine/phosphatidylglycerophosphate/cardiolipin synthase-like enzyme